MKRVEFDGEIHEFPDDFTDDDISAALSAIPPKKPAAGMGDLKLAESQAEPIPEAPQPAGITDRPYMNPMVNLGLKAGKAGLQFAGNVATALSTGPANAIAQGIQDDAGVMGTAGNVVRAVADPFIPGKSPIQSTETTLERMGVPNKPREWSIPVSSDPLRPQFQTYASPGTASDLGLLVDVGTPLYGLAAVKAAGAAARAALMSKAGQKTLKAAGGAAGLANKGAGRLAEEMSGVSEDALRLASTDKGRLALEAAAGQESQIGAELLQNIDNADDFIPERALVDEVLDHLPPQPVQPAIDAMESVRAATIREGGRVAPHARPAHSFIQGYIDYLRGGPLPPDLAKAAQEAGRTAQGTKAQAATLMAEAAQDAKAASQAERLAVSAQSKASKAAAKAGKTKKEFLEASDKAEGNVLRWGRARNEAGQAAEAALDEAQAAAVKAREAAVTARSRVAIGEITGADAQAAEAAASAAAQNYYIAEVASRVKGGEKLKTIADDLAARGMPKDAMVDALKKGRKRAESIPELPPQEVSAKGLRSFRQDIDVPVDFATEGADIRTAALKAGRGTIKNQLIKAAEDSGIPGYADAMRSWSDKLDKLDRIKDMLGKTGATREKRVEQFINNLFGKNNRYKTQLMKDLDGIFGSNLTERARTTQLASQLGDAGTAGWLPRQTTGRALLGHVVGTPVSSALLASPKIASRVTLPFLSHLETSLKAGNIPITPRAAQALAALKKPLNETQKARLINILAAELEAGTPANVIPFQPKKVAEEDDKDSSTLSMRTP